MNGIRYKFIQDQDCHWYLIPDELTSLFIQMEESGEADWYAEFNKKFQKYGCDHPSNFTFENPL